MQATHQGHAVGLADPKALISDPLRQRGGIIESSPAIIELPELEFNQRLVVAGRENCEVEFLDEGRVKIEGIVYRRLDQASPEQIFRCCGEFWQFKYLRREVLLSHHVGFEYIRELIRRQGECIGCVELVDLITAKRRTGDGTGGKGTISADSAIAECLQVGEAEGEDRVIDQQTVAEIEDAIFNFELAITEAREAGDFDLVENLDEKVYALDKYLHKSSRNGKPRRKSGDRDKARTAVSNAITRALETLKVHHRAFYDFLKLQISLGFTLIYTPYSAVNFVTD